MHYIHPSRVQLITLNYLGIVTSFAGLFEVFYVFHAQ